MSEIGGKLLETAKAHERAATLRTAFACAAAVVIVKVICDTILLLAGK